MTENGTNYLYACVIASMATGIPEDFFTSLSLYEPVSYTHLDVYKRQVLTANGYTTESYKPPLVNPYDVTTADQLMRCV